MNEVERPVLRSASDPLTRGLIITFHEGLFDGAHQLRVAADLDGALLFLHDRQPAALFFFADVIGQIQRGGIGPARVLEAEQRIVFHFVQQRQRLLEVLFGLAGKAHDDVGGDGDVAARLLHPIDAAHVFVARVEPLHASQHVRGSGLHRKMHVIAQHRIVVDGVDDFLDEIARVRSGEAHAPDAIHFAHRAQQPREIPAGGRRIAIAVHVLAQQLDFDVAHARQLARFVQHAFAGAAALGPARERHHAIGAGFVAAFDDRDVGAVRIVAPREGRFERLIVVQAQAGDAAVSAFQLHQHLRQLGIAGRSRYQADVRGALENALAFLLRHATQHAKHFALAVTA